MRLIAVLLLVCGSIVMLVGIGGAVREVGMAYKHALDEPLGTHEEDEGGALRDRMLVWVGVGVIGFVPALVGGTMLKVGIMRKFIRSQRTSSVPVGGPRLEHGESSGFDNGG